MDRFAPKDVWPDYFSPHDVWRDCPNCPTNLNLIGGLEVRKYDVSKFLKDASRIAPEEFKADEDRVAHMEERRVLGMVALQIRRALRKQGLSQSEFASMMGVDDYTVSLWLCGRYDFKLSTLSKMQKVLGIEIVNNWYYPKH